MNVLTRSVVARFDGRILCRFKIDTEARLYTLKAVVPFDEFATGIRGGIHDEVIADGSICRRGVIDDVARSKIVERAVANTASNRKSVVDLPIVFNVKGRFNRIF